MGLVVGAGLPTSAEEVAHPDNGIASSAEQE